MVIQQGDVFWVDPGPPLGSRPGHRHPYVVIQNNVFNTGGIRTVLICGITSNLRRADAPGNVLLAKGEANLPERSVVNVSAIVTANKSELTDKIGTLSPARIRQILDGVYLWLEPREPDASRALLP